MIGWANIGRSLTAKVTCVLLLTVINLKTDSLPAGAAIDMLLYFTKTEFDALKAADFSIASPDYLTVVRQPSTTDAAPAAYTPVAGEELIMPVTWDSVSGGYFIKILASGTGNFFIQKITTKTSCAAVGTSFASNITGATYQWQVNTGVNFLSFSNDANYSGTNTATLQINNIPSAFNGYRYRCVVDNTKVSNAFYLQIANVWSGAVNNLWENPANWSCGTVPDANTDVIVNSGTVTVNSAAVCKSLQLSPSAKLYVTTGFNLNVLN